MIRQSTIDNIHHALDAAQTAAAKFDSAIWWRGHAAILDWRLLPTVYRDGFADPTRHEKNLSVRFVAGAGSRHAHLPEQGNWDEWLVLMQHYGLPTRLLDWTESVLVALYFVVRDHPSEDGRLFALHPFRLNEKESGLNMTFSPGHQQVAELFAPPFRNIAPNPKTIAAFIPLEKDMRMLVQQSSFTVHGPALSIDGLAYRDDILIQWDVPSSAKNGLMVGLSALGINESTLFPDLEHLAKYISGQNYRYP